MAYDQRIVPHPDVDRLSNSELRAALADADQRLEIHHKAGLDADPLTETWLVQERRLILSEFSRRTGQAENNTPNSIPHLREQNRAELTLELLTWDQFLSKAPETREWTVDELIPESGLGVIQGRGKQGKSTLIRHLCGAVASGKRFLGREIKQKPVVYVNYEMPDDYMQLLLRSAEVPANTYIANRPELILSLDTIEAFISKVGSSSGLLVVDSFRGAFKLAGKAENLAGEAGVLLRRIQDLALAKGWFILLIHHRNRAANEGTDSISGTGDWIAAPDVILTWARSEATEPGTLYAEGRIPPVEPMSVRLSLEECVFVGTVKDSKAATDKEAIAAVLSGEGQTADSIAQATGLPPGTVRARLESMFKDGLAERTGGGKRGSPYLWLKTIPQETIPLGAETNLEFKEKLAWTSEL